MKSLSYRVLVFMLSLGCASLARADQSVAIPALQDVTLFGASTANNNTSSGPGMFVGTDGTGAPKRGLIEFNIASYVPAGATITSASLTLYLGMVAGSGGGGTGGDSTFRSFNLHTVSTAWNGTTQGTTGHPGPGFGGTGMGFAPLTGNATWNYAMYNTKAWATPGGDFSSTVSSSFTETTTPVIGAPYTWPSTSQMVLNVQQWLDGTTSNNGWLVQNTDEVDPTDFRAFYTREGAAEQSVPQYAPELNVEYTMAPEPSVGLLLLAMPLFLRRKRSRSTE